MGLEASMKTNESGSDSSRRYHVVIVLDESRWFPTGGCIREQAQRGSESLVRLDTVFVTGVLSASVASGDS